MEIDARGLNLPCMPLKDAGEGIEPIAGLWADEPWPERKGGGKANACPLLPVEVAGKGGENGNWGY